LNTAKERFPLSEYFTMPEGYRCPLCPTHDDDDFCWHHLLSTPICRACSHEIINLVYDEKRIDDSALDQLEAVTGLSYEELQVAVLMPEIRHKEKILKSRDFAANHQNSPQFELDEWIEMERQELARTRRMVAIAKAKIRVRKKSEQRSEKEIP
jgi:hypothetical protein